MYTIYAQPFYTTRLDINGKHWPPSTQVIHKGGRPGRKPRAVVAFRIVPTARKVAR